MHKSLGIVLFLNLAAAAQKTITSPGQSCECSDREEFAAKLAALQTEIDELKGRVQPTSSNRPTTESNQQVQPTAPIGWTQASNNLYYKFFKKRVNYETAKSKCASFGARLAAAGMRTTVLKREIKNFFPKWKNHNTWIGLDDLVRQGRYIWSDGVKSTTKNTDWYPGRQNERNGRCAFLTGGGKTYDYSCSFHTKYLCELAP